MPKVTRGRRDPLESSSGQNVRGKESTARQDNQRRAEAWLSTVVFGSAEAKLPVNIRLDADIVRYFRAGGPGYQTRINEVLKAFVTARLKAGDLPGALPKPRANGRKKSK